MLKISDSARQNIEAAIARAEKLSRAELVAVIAGRAGEYRATGLTLSLIGTFAIGVIAWYFLPWSSTGEILVLEFAAFLLLFALLELSPLGDRLTPDFMKTEAAHRLACTCFLEQGLSSAEERNAILFFVSLSERHVEIIADKAIHQLVGTDKWQSVVDALGRKIGAGLNEEGFVTAISALGEILAQHYPADGERTNMIGNRLIVL